MGIIIEPHPVKLFIGMLSQDMSLIEQLTDSLQNMFGPIDLSSPVLPWEHTKYYEKEMGEGLKRKFIFFEKLVHPGTIADIKLRTMELESRRLKDKGGREINLDPGYLDAAKIVLASTKDFSHRIYLDKGIYGEVTLMYSGKDYQTLPYTFPDYRTKEYWDIFKTARELFKSEIKKRLNPDQ
jgi:hypothetical protein